MFRHGGGAKWEEAASRVETDNSRKVSELLEWPTSVTGR